MGLMNVPFVPSGGGGGNNITSYANLAAFPTVGEADHLYIALDIAYSYYYNAISSTYVHLDDTDGEIVEVANFAALPTVGVVNILYLTLDTGLLYRWGASAYAGVSTTLAIGHGANMAFRGSEGLANTTAIATANTALTNLPYQADGLAFSEIGGDLATLIYPDNLVKFGGITVANDVVAVGGFTNAKYINASSVFTHGSQPHERYAKITTGSNVTTEQWMMSTTTDFTGWMIGIKSSKIFTYASSNGTSWDLFGALGTQTILANTTYHIKFYFTGTEYKIDLSTDGANYVNHFQHTSSLGIINYPPQYGTLGQPTWIGDLHFFGGIDFNDSYLNANGVITYGSFGSSVNFTGTALLKGANGHLFNTTPTKQYTDGFADGSYVILAHSSGVALIKATRLFKQATEPSSPLHDDVWVNTLKLPMSTQIWDSSIPNWISVNYAKIRTTFTIVGGKITGVATGDYGVRPIY